MFANCHTINLIMCSRNGRSKGIQRACLVSFLIKFCQETGYIRGGSWNGIATHFSTPHSPLVELWVVGLGWLGLSRLQQELSSLLWKGATKDFTQKQVTCLVEGPSPLGHLLVLEITPGTRAISLGKFQNIPSSTGYQVWTLYAGATSTSWARWRRDNSAN